MASGRSYQANFTQGRLSHELGGRVDLQAYAAGLGDGVNGIVAVSGPVRRRAGFVDLGPARSNASLSRLLPFSRSALATFMLELGDHAGRVWTADAVLVAGEFSIPYASADLQGLRRYQSNDVLFMVHASCLLRPMALQRTGVSTFAVTPLRNVNGPFRDENSDDAFTVASSGSVGAVSLTASKDLFVAGHVGALFRLREAAGGVAGRSWAPATEFSPGEICASDGKIYRVNMGVSVKTGNSPPLHDRGAVYDGGINWEYMHDGAGVVQITDVSDARNAGALVLSRIPSSTNTAGKLYLPLAGDNLAVTATAFWSEAAWSDVRGWPGAIETDDERLVFAGTLSDPGGFYATRVNGFGPDWVDFYPGLGTGRVADDDAISKTIGAGGDPVAWLISAGYLLCGTTSKERAIIGDTWDDPPTPGATRFRPISGEGSEPVEPLLAASSVIFVPRGGRTVHALQLDDQGSYVGKDLGLLAEFGDERIVELAWAAHPDAVLWARTDAGSLLSCTYDPKQNVTGWMQQALAGGFKVESLAVSPSDFETPWLVVSRVKGGVTQRRVWRQARRWRKGQAQTLICYHDAAVLGSGAATATIGGLAHLEGELVRVFADGGRVIFKATVSSGQVAVPEGQTVTAWCVGLPYAFRVESLPLDVSGPVGSIGLKQRVTACELFLTDAVDGYTQFGDGDLERIGGPAWGASPPTPGDLVERVPVGGATTRRPTVAFETDGPWPATLLAIRAETTINA